MKIEEKNWKNIKKLFVKAARTTGHFSFATTGKDGIPHVTPIGSLFLTDFCRGFYFEEYVAQMAKNLKDNRRICVMAVNGSNMAFLRALIRGRTDGPVSIRLTGRVGDKREATKREQEKFLKLVKPFRWTRGYKVIWNNLRHVRDIQFDSIEPVKIGTFTGKQEV